MNRRSFLKSASRAALAAAVLPLPNPAAAASSWPIGCFNRAWTKWSFDTALDGIASAGYKIVGLLSGHKGEAFTSATATPEYLNELKKRIARRELTANMSTLRFRPDAPADENIANVRKQIENAARLELRCLLTFGVDSPKHYEAFYRLMADAAAEGARRNLQIAMKPHGGASGASEEILRCLDKVGHDNFKIWYDAGNIIYYTGKNPVAELEPIARHVTGFCAKDCAGPRQEVMTQFGTGKVDFTAVFRKLKSADFNGPIMVEGIEVGDTPEETAAHASANRAFLENALAQL